MPSQASHRIGRYLGAAAPVPGSLTAVVSGQIRDEFGLLPEPLALHSPVPELLAAGWAILRETVIVGGRLGRPAKEAMAVAVSASNRCPYCVDAHGIALHALGNGATETALARGRQGRLGPELEALLAWAAASRRADHPRLARPPFGPAEAPEAIGTVLCFQYINRMATVLLAETLLPRWLRWPLLPLVGRRMRRFAEVQRAPGASLPPLPPVEPGAHLAWAAASPPIATAFAAMDAATAAAVGPLLSPEGQARVRHHLAGWRGEDPPFGFAWLDETLAGLTPGDAAAARLGLLAALAPHRVDEKEIAAFRRSLPADVELVAVLAWACFQTARRISEWLGQGA